MNETELRAAAVVRAALLNQLNQMGMHVLPDRESEILRWFESKGVKPTAERGYLELTMSDGNQAIPSASCETLRRERPDLFASDAKRDAVSCRQDLERGTQSEVYAAKAQYIETNGIDRYEALPKTKAEAELQATPVSLDMNRSQWLALKFSERARLAGVLGPDAIGRIMARPK